MKKIKAQMSIGDAPNVVLLVGLTFLVLATMALVGDKYGNSMDTDNVAYSKFNETLTTVTGTGEYLTLSNYKNGLCNPVILITNASTGVIIAAGNYTQTNCLIKSITSDMYNNTNWNVSYSGTRSVDTVATNVTNDLNTEISNNTSIAGIVLTISLVGIVLSILIGVFLGITNRSGRI